MRKLKRAIKAILHKSCLGRKIIRAYLHALRPFLIPIMRRRMRKHWPEIVNRVHALMQKNGFKYCIEGGTLLGVIREKHPLVHDDDVDFSILPSDASPSRLLKILLEDGFQFLRAFEYEGRVTEISVTYQKVGVDFFFYFVEGDRMYSNSYYWDESCPDGDHWKGHQVFRPLVDKLIEVSVCGATMLAPENFDDVLTATYGNWRVPDAKWSYVEQAERDKERRRKLTGFGHDMSLEEVLQK